MLCFTAYLCLNVIVEIIYTNKYIEIARVKCFTIQHLKKALFISFVIEMYRHNVINECSLFNDNTLFELHAL